MRLEAVNTGKSEMKYLGISTSGATEVVEYPDSGKFAVSSRFDWAAGKGGVRYVGRVENSLDYAAHSLYLRVGFEQGVPGAVLIIVLLAVTAGLALVLAARDADVAGVGGAALLGSWIGLIANSAFVDTLHWRHLWLVAALIWAGYAALSSRATGRATERLPG